MPHLLLSIFIQQKVRSIKEGERRVSLKPNNKSNRNNEVCWEMEPGASVEK